MKKLNNVKVAVLCNLAINKTFFLYSTFKIRWTQNLPNSFLRMKIWETTTNAKKINKKTYWRRKKYMKKSFQSDIPANSIFFTFRCQVEQQLFNKPTMLDFKWGDVRFRDNATDFYKALCSTIHLKSDKRVFYYPGIKGLRNASFPSTAWNNSKERGKKEKPGMCSNSIQAATQGK